MAQIIQKSSISISGLPSSCQHKSRLESYVSSPSASVNIVLTLESGQFVAYIGYPDIKDLKPELQNSRDILYHCNRIRSHNQVAQLGDRLDEATRDFLFPNRRTR